MLLNYFMLAVDFSAMHGKIISQWAKLSIVLSRI